MKNIDKAIKKHIAESGGRTMRTYAVSDPRFSRVKSSAMFHEKDEKDDDIEEAKENEKETDNPSKKVKPIKKMKHGGKKK